MNLGILHFIAKLFKVALADTIFVSFLVITSVLASCQSTTIEPNSTALLNTSTLPLSAEAVGTTPVSISKGNQSVLSTSPILNVTPSVLKFKSNGTTVGGVPPKFTMSTNVLPWSVVVLNNPQWIQFTPTSYSVPHGTVTVSVSNYISLSGQDRTATMRFYYGPFGQWQPFKDVTISQSGRLIIPIPFP